jgi:hypothetical protein
MQKHKPIISLLIASLALAPLAGCDSLPGDKKTQGAVIGGVGGAVAGGALAKNNRLIGALIGGALGAGGGYLIGSSLDKSDPKKNRDDAVRADRRAQENPATADDAKRARTADINNDGYVTMDEVVAMAKAGLNDDEMITRLERTGQFFELNNEQEQYLRDHGVSRRVVTAMRDINQDVRTKAYDRYDTSSSGSSSNRNDRISNDR